MAFGEIVKDVGFMGWGSRCRRLSVVCCLVKPLIAGIEFG